MFKLYATRRASGIMEQAHCEALSETNFSKGKVFNKLSTLSYAFFLLRC